MPLMAITRELRPQYECDQCGQPKHPCCFQPSAVRDKNRQLICGDCRRKKTPSQSQVAVLKSRPVLQHLFYRNNFEASAN